MLANIQMSSYIKDANHKIQQYAQYSQYPYLPRLYPGVYNEGGRNFGQAELGAFYGTARKLENPSIYEGPFMNGRCLPLSDFLQCFFSSLN